MGLMDKLGGLFGGNKSSATDSVKPPSVVLKENGIDPSRLEFTFNSDGSVGVSGTAASASDIERIRELVGGIPGITRVDSRITVQSDDPKPAPEHAADSEGAPEAPAPQETGAAPDKYTVKSGDSLWKISAEIYGDGSQYMKIFEANNHILEHPDKIFPGQELIIPAKGE